MITEGKDGKSMKISLKYERLTNYCFGHGCLRHILKDYDKEEDLAKENEEDDEALTYGPWLHALTLKTSGCNIKNGEGI